jgi:hypothetical protein
VGPAVEEGADEAFGFAVCLWPVGACAEVADAELSAGDGVDDAAVGRAVVGEDPLDRDAVAAVVALARWRKPIAVVAFSSVRTSA